MKDKDKKEFFNSMEKIPHLITNHKVACSCMSNATDIITMASQWQFCFKCPICLQEYLITSTIPDEEEEDADEEENG